MRTGLLWSCLLLSLAAGCTSRYPPLNPAPGLPPPVRLDFKPPVDRLLTESVRATRTLQREGQREVRDEAAFTTETRFTPSDGGWRVAQSMRTPRQVHDGHDVPSVSGAVLERFTLRMQLAADGTFVKLVGPEAAQEALRQVAPEGTGVPEVERFFNPEALEIRTRREWEAKYAGLLQRNLVEGQRTWAVDSVDVNGEERAFLLERTVEGTRLTTFGDAVVLTLKCLDALPPNAPAELKAAWAEAGSPELSKGVTCEGEQVVTWARFIPVRRLLKVKAVGAGGTLTLTTESQAEQLQEEGP
ncbi:hypothetical protein D7Y27_28465 [Corallococcus sp. AB004]|uniref:hypothetical protein n=1 Tax=Corallococcus TaxID=83461 RepID=UPI000EA2B3E7|nr:MULTISPECIES: hypothetical protein [Corallococcus]RKI36389.1 hypothetical protein D7Y27_28465 [Corallococcus sp. AB004]NRD49656.1 hypothetical protein [Corallococcus exiguus]RKH26225.1 hypothetical protein D7V77_15220 [Corallococcus sp. CA041A]RKI03078.1 hypothetical protein D7Y15_33900 [Corallococcus sp. AB030]RKI05128.1 hypothetical protein D7Y04_09750 [Corallococcus sp. AB038B]